MKALLSFLILGFALTGCSSWDWGPKVSSSESPPYRSIAQSAGSTCPQQEQAFTNVLNDFRGCKDVAFPDQSKCHSFCQKADLLLGGGYGPQQCPPQVCSQQDLANARQQGRTQGQQEVLRDLSVRAILEIGTSYGVTEEDCKRRAQQIAGQLRSEAIANCNAQAVVIKNCDVTAPPKISVAPARVPSILGESKIKVKKKNSDEATCKAQAVTAAQQDALNKCRQITGYDCTLNSAAPITTHKIDSDIFSKDDRVCTAKVYADARADVVYQCRGSIEAVNQARSGAGY